MLSPYRSIKPDAERPYIKILAYKNCVLVCTSKDWYTKVKTLLGVNPKGFITAPVCRHLRSDIRNGSRVKGNNPPCQQFSRQAAFEDMDGHEFEYFCADLLEQRGFVEVEVTRGSGDYGIDILAEKDGGGLQMRKPPPPSISISWRSL